MQCTDFVLGYHSTDFAEVRIEATVETNLQFYASFLYCVQCSIDFIQTEITWIAAYALLMMVVCMLACVVPTRRALRIQPMHALKTDA